MNVTARVLFVSFMESPWVVFADLTKKICYRKIDTTKKNVIAR